MKQEVKRMLKERNMYEIYSEEKYLKVKEFMKRVCEKDEWLKHYLSLDPLNKAEWVCHHIVEFHNRGLF